MLNSGGLDSLAVSGAEVSEFSVLLAALPLASSALSGKAIDSLDPISPWGRAGCGVEISGVESEEISLETGWVDRLGLDACGTDALGIDELRVDRDAAANRGSGVEN